MDGEGEEAFTLEAQEGLFSPRSFPQGMLNATPRFQSTMGGGMLNGVVGVICTVWVDDTVVKGRTPQERLEILLPILWRLLGEGVVCGRPQVQRSPRVCHMVWKRILQSWSGASPGVH